MRPTPDALREQAFAIIGPHLAGAVFLDLFAGTGVNSLEALSRGAGRAILVERASAAATLIRRNFGALEVPEERWELVTAEAGRALPALAARGVACALAWCDPPFDAWAEGTVALATARRLGVVCAGAHAVLEAPPKVSPAVDGFAVVRELRGAFLLVSNA